jgi:hypothetical protein
MPRHPSRPRSAAAHGWTRQALLTVVLCLAASPSGAASTLATAAPPAAAPSLPAVVDAPTSTPQATLQAHCDISGSGTAQAAPDAATCRERCLSHAPCAAFVFVSGWNRCFLKEKAARIAALLRFYAGRIAVDGQTRRVADAGYDRDDSGKDMRKLPHTASAAACAAACLGEAGCLAFAYLEGYGDCYLKATHGIVRDKIFSCGVVDGR